MKKVLTILFAITLIGPTASAQRELEQKVAKILKHIERNLSVETKISAKADVDFFIYDLSVDQTGKISDVHIFLMDSISHLSRATEVGNVIKEKFVFEKATINKLLIPVMIIKQESEEGDSQTIKSVLESIKIFEAFRNCEIKGVHLSRLATIRSYSTNKN